MRLQLDSSLPGLNGNGVSAVGTAGRNSPGVNQTAGAVDSASLSGTSKLLSQIFADRAGHIAQLTAAVQDGSYDVPSAAISKAIVDEALA